MDKKYVAVKLSSGEDVLAYLHAEDPNGVLLLHPMQICHETDQLDHIENYWAQPLCPFSEENTFFVEKHHLVYIKDMSKYLIPHYHLMVKQFSESQVIKHARLHAEHKVEWGGEEISEQEAKRRVEQIRAIREFNSRSQEDDTTLH